MSGARLSASLFAILLVAGTGAAPAGAQSPAGDPVRTADERAEVLVLGVYHMANPGSDVVNTTVDDVLSLERQAQIEELLEVLERFRPTRIAVEVDFSDDEELAAEYEAYRSGEYALTRNEVDQIGLRLAAKLGLDAIEAVDVSGEFPWPRLVDYAKANGYDAEFQSMMDDLTRASEATDAYLKTHTVLETLLQVNSDAAVDEDMAMEYRRVHLGESWNWAGADLAAAWFHRNARIFSNIVDLVESPEERVLVIFGAGHLPWLRHAVSSDPSLRLRTLAQFVR